MKKEKRIVAAEGPRHEECAGYNAAVREGEKPENEGEDNGSVVGCYANNDRASARSANCNNAANNGNGNYAGAFAVNRDKPRLTSCAASTKTTENPVATGVQDSCDYGLLPFMGDNNAESGDEATSMELVMEELETANNKRKLKNLKRFFTNRCLIELAFDRTMKRSHASKREKRRYISDKERICDRIERELTDKTYAPEPSERRVIVKKGKGDKNRNADVFVMYDRIVQTLILIVIGLKMRHTMPDYIYSGIEGRSLLSNSKRYCMVNKIRHWVATHKDSYVGLTDIRHFYEELDMRIALGELFKVVVCPYTRWLLLTVFSRTRHLPIGGCLSQLVAMYILSLADREMLRRYNVRLFAFGDNRLICGGKREVREAMSFYMSYYEGRFNLSVKGDYQTRKVRDGFRFCKYDFKGSFVSVRAEIRRRAIRAYGRGQKHYAGYKGMLMKTDSKRLRHLIENRYMEIVNRHGITVTSQRGDKLKLRDVPEGSEVVVAEYKIEPSEAKAKEGKSGMMVRMTYILIDANGKKRLCHSTEGSEEVVGFFQLVDEGKAELHQRLHVGREGNRIFFAEYHTTKEEACEIICRMLNI